MNLEATTMLSDILETKSIERKAPKEHGKNELF